MLLAYEMRALHRREGAIHLSTQMGWVKRPIFFCHKKI